jgi:hypothetical protein
MSGTTNPEMATAFVQSVVQFVKQENNKDLGFYEADPEIIINTPKSTKPFSLVYNLTDEEGDYVCLHVTVRIGDDKDDRVVGYHFSASDVPYDGTSLLMTDEDPEPTTSICKMVCDKVGVLVDRLSRELGYQRSYGVPFSTSPTKEKASKKPVVEDAEF